MYPMFVTPPRFQRRRQTHQFLPRQSLQSRPLSRCLWRHQRQARSRLERTLDSGSPGETHLSQGRL
jgi:hypothetical protein